MQVNVADDKVNTVMSDILATYNEDTDADTYLVALVAALQVVIMSMSSHRQEYVEYSHRIHNALISSMDVVDESN